jgi:hypothetical protein
MVEFCREHDLKYEVCGKVIVASSEAEIPGLKQLFERGNANGLAGLRMLSKEQLQEIEPHCGGLQGVLVPSTGITDYAAVSRKYAEIVAAQGGNVHTRTEVKRVAPRGQEMVVETTRRTFSARNVINCAGLHSDRVSRMAGREPEVRIVPFRGEYYDLVPERTHLVRTLIYPVPDPKFPSWRALHTPRTRWRRRRTECGAGVQARRLQAHRFQFARLHRDHDLFRFLALGGEILARWFRRILSIVQQAGICKSTATTGTGNRKFGSCSGRFRSARPSRASGWIDGGRLPIRPIGQNVTRIECSLARSYRFPAHWPPHCGNGAGSVQTGLNRTNIPHQTLRLPASVACRHPRNGTIASIQTTPDSRR